MAPDSTVRVVLKPLSRGMDTSIEFQGGGRSPPRTGNLFQRFRNRLRRGSLYRAERRLALWLPLLFVGLYGGIVGRMIYIGYNADDFLKQRQGETPKLSIERPDIIDRNGALLATDQLAHSIGIRTRYLSNKAEAVNALTEVLAGVDQMKLLSDLTSGKTFVPVKRKVRNDELDTVFRLGIPGIEFEPEHQRIYPNGRLGSHILGAVDIDNHATSGFEKYIDNKGLIEAQELGLQLSGADMKPFELSIDLKLQHALRDELAKGVEKFHAIAGAGVIYDVMTGEVLSLVSLPDYDSNQPAEAVKPDNLNRILVGTYEMGSTMKALNTAMALESGKISINDAFDTKGGEIEVQGETIHEYHGTGRKLTVPEVFIHSSNIGSVRMALEVGTKGQRDFLQKMGILERLTTELPESAAPILPKPWNDLATATVSFGHGITMTPLSAIRAVGALVNGGHLVNPTFLKQEDMSAYENAPIVISPKTSEALRYVMRLNAVTGTAKIVDLPGYYVGGKTGTAEKVVNGAYQPDKNFNTLMAIVPADKPRYLYAIILDDPKAIPETHNQATAAVNAGDVCAKVIERTMPMLMPPRFKYPEHPFPNMEAQNAWGLDQIKAR